MTKVIDVVSAAGSEAVACVDVLAGRMSVRVKSRPATSNVSGVEVALVHGFMSSERDMRHWEDRLGAVCSVRVLGYESLGKGFLETAESLLASTEDLGGGSILVGHSLGGIFCRYLAEHSVGKYAAVVTVCSPNTAKDASLGTRITARAASPLPTVVEGAVDYLNSRDTWSVGDTACYTFGAACDVIVSERSSRLAGAEHSVISRAGHMSVLRRPEVPEKVMAILRSYETETARQ